MPTGVYIRTEETRRKLSEAHKGLPGHPNSKETLEKLRAANTGRPMPENVKAALVASRIGRPTSDAQKAAVRKAHLGVPRSAETKAKLSAGKKGVAPSEQCRLGYIAFRTGRPQSPESNAKRSLAERGEKNWNWKGGIVPENKRARRYVEYRLWRDQVYIRDDYTCQKCGQRGGHLVAHHRDSFADFPEQRFTVANGITLCANCHAIFHKRYKMNHNRWQQTDEFLNNKEEQYA